MTKEEIKSITDTCFISHQDEIIKLNSLHLKKVKSAIFTRVTLPVTILIALGLLVLRSMNSIGIEVARHQAITTEKVDAMGIAIMDEAKLRKENDNRLGNADIHLEKKLDDNLQYLYQNSMFKTRGGDLPFTASNKEGK